MLTTEKTDCPNDMKKDESTTKMNPLHKEDSTPQLSMDASIRTEPLVKRHSLDTTPSIYTPRLSTLILHMIKHHQVLWVKQHYHPAIWKFD